MKKLTKDKPSEYRIEYNRLVEKYSNGKVLDIGKSMYWDYDFDTIDIDTQINPTYLADICNSNLESNKYDLVLCNGMFEFVSNQQKMVDEVYRLLKHKGIVIFGFVGRDYPAYKPDWKCFDNNIDFKDMTILEIINFKKEYHFIICQKLI